MPAESDSPSADYVPEFSEPGRGRMTATAALAGHVRRAAPSIAHAYAATFAVGLGERVLADLMIKFGPTRSRFPVAPFMGQTDPLLIAALIEGQASVMVEIAKAIVSGCGAGGAAVPPSCVPFLPLFPVGPVG